MIARWLLDTSAYSRRHIPVVREDLAQRLDAGEELCLSAPTLLELLRTPRGTRVAAERETLGDAFAIVGLTERTGELAADAMVKLAAHTTDGHRLPVADLLTAALAAERGLGVLHIDKHFDRLATIGDLDFKSAPACSSSDLTDIKGTSPAARQRELRRTLHATLSRLPSVRAEELLTEFIERAGTPRTRRART